MVGILKPNVDPHDFEPTPSTAIALSGAQLVVESGAGLDRWTAGLVSNSMPGTPIWVASAGLPLRGDDPHWWFDPTLFQRAATDLGDRLARLDPAHASAYRARARGYAAQIRAMDAANRRLIATVPPAKRLLVTNHDAFGYFAAHYRIRVVGSVIPSMSTEAEASASDVASLISRIQGDLHGVVAEPEAGAADRLRGRSQGVREPVRGHAGPGRLSGWDIHRDGTLGHAGDGRRVPGQTASRGVAPAFRNHHVTATQRHVTTPSQLPTPPESGSNPHEGPTRLVEPRRCHRCVTANHSCVTDLAQRPSRAQSPK